tara:strand:+ start:79 stop:408 length:330 start_codon:yes stop_codon:yes gene_type:complete
MQHTKESIQNQIRGIKNGNIPMIELIGSLINIYGFDEETKNKNFSNVECMKCVETSKYITTNSLDKFLDIILGEGKDIAMAIQSNSVFSEQFTFHYDVEQGEGIIGLKQ